MLLTLLHIGGIRAWSLYDETLMALIVITEVVLSSKFEADSTIINRTDGTIIENLSTKIVINSIEN